MVVIFQNFSNKNLNVGSLEIEITNCHNEDIGVMLKKWQLSSRLFMHITWHAGEYNGSTHCKPTHLHVQVITLKPAWIKCEKYRNRSPRVFKACVSIQKTNLKLLKSYKIVPKVIKSKCTFFKMINLTIFDLLSSISDNSCKLFCTFIYRPILYLFAYFHIVLFLCPLHGNMKNFSRLNTKEARNS